MDKYVFGVDIGGTTVKIGLFKSDGELIHKFAIDTVAGEALLSDVKEALAHKLAELNIDIKSLLGVGIGVPGPVDEDGVVSVGVNIGWPDPVAVKAQMEELLGGTIPVFVTNDANAAALGELYLGAAKGAKNAIMFTLGTGVGGGVIVNGNVINGHHGAGGEIGHLTVDQLYNFDCGCGRTGCLETVASATGVVNLATIALKEKKSSVLRNMSNLVAKDVFDAAKAGDEIALAVVDKVSSFLGQAAANLAVTTNPEVFIIGGGVSLAGDILFDGIKQYFNQAFAPVKDTPFVAATLGNDAGIVGGAYLVLSRSEGN